MKSLLNTRVIKESKKDRYFKVNYRTQKLESVISFRCDCFPSVTETIEYIKKNNNEIQQDEGVLILSHFEFKSRADYLNYKK